MLIKNKCGGIIKVGDLVKCIWQPNSAAVDPQTHHFTKMKYVIKEKIGIISKISQPQGELLRCVVVFPQCDGYAHVLAHNAFEIIE